MMNIRSLDLNLLVVFGALSVEKSTTKAAAKLGLSQPAVSHALARLRHQLGDPLFVRGARGLVATPRALELEKPVQALLDQLKNLVVGVQVFNPAQAKNVFRIATTDFFEQVTFPRLLREIEETAPNVTIISRPTSATLPRREIESGELDFAIAGFYVDVPEGFRRQKLFDDDFVCVARADHPRLGKKALSLKSFAQEKHILISIHGDLKAKTSEILEKQGLKQQFRAGLASFLAPGWILSETNYLLTCPRKLAQSYQKHLPVKTYELPFAMPNIHISQIWHERQQSDPAHMWLRQLIFRICQDL